MIKIAIILFRECLEISLLLSIILAVTKNIINSRYDIILGSMLGVVGAALFAFGAKFITVKYYGLGDEIFDIIVILTTVVMIIWTVVWIKKYESNIEERFKHLQSLPNPGFSVNLMLVLVVATSILREGTEIILFVYSISAVDTISINDYLVGIGLGGFIGFFVGFLIYSGLIKFANRYIFKVSSFLLMLIAAGLASKAAAILTSFIPNDNFSNQLWDSSWLIRDTSVIGKFLNAIMGYNAKPNILQAIFYFVTILIVCALMKWQALYHLVIKNNKHSKIINK